MSNLISTLHEINFMRRLTADDEAAQGTSLCAPAYNRALFRTRSRALVDGHRRRSGAVVDELHFAYCDTPDGWTRDDPDRCHVSRATQSHTRCSSFAFLHQSTATDARTQRRILRIHRYGRRAHLGSPPAGVRTPRGQRLHLPGAARLL